MQRLCPRWRKLSPVSPGPPLPAYPGVLRGSFAVPARGVEPGCETSVPGANRNLVPDLTDLDATLSDSVITSTEAPAFSWRLLANQAMLPAARAFLLAICETRRR